MPLSDLRTIGLTDSSLDWEPVLINFGVASDFKDGFDQARQASAGEGTRQRPIAGMAGSICSLPSYLCLVTGVDRAVCFWYYDAPQLFYAIAGYEYRLSSNCAKSGLLVKCFWQRKLNMDNVTSIALSLL